MKRGKETVKLYYLSGTGNSLKIVKDIGSRMGEHERISMPHALKGGGRVSVEGDIVGFVFPVYFARLPVFVEEFMGKAEFGKIGYLFAVANGGGLFGRTLASFDGLAADRGKELDAGFRVPMPGNHPRMALVRRKNGGNLLEEEYRKAGRIAETVAEKRRYREEIGKGMSGLLVSFLFGYGIPWEYSREHVLDNYFWLNENCANCGTCAELCPVGNIVPAKRRPLWQNRCINCFACYNHCPWKSIQVRCPWKIFPLESDWIQMPRYHNPDIPLSDIRGVG